MPTVRDCREGGGEGRCELPSDAAFSAEVDRGAWERAYGEGSWEIAGEALLLDLSEVLMCDLAVNALDEDGDELRLSISHDCPAEEGTIAEVAGDIGERLSRESRAVREVAELPIEGREIGLPPEREGAALSSEGCAVRAGDQYLVSPTRKCINEVRSALAARGSGMNLTEAWGAAKEGERIEIFEDVLGSYIFYKLPPDTLLPTGVCFEMFGEGVIDGHKLGYYHLPEELREAARGEFETAGEALGWYLDHDGLNLAWGGGACEGLSRMLKDSGSVPRSWAWFGDREGNLVVLDPEGAEEILEGAGFEVSVRGHEIEREETSLTDVLGINCSLRGYQVDPVCAWWNKISEVEGDADYRRTEPEETRVPVVNTGHGTYSKLRGRMLDLYEERGIEAVRGALDAEVREPLSSVSGPPVAGGYVKAPTGSGKTVLSLVAFGAMGGLEGGEAAGRPPVQRAEEPELGPPESEVGGEVSEPGGGGSGEGGGETDRQALISLVRERRDAGVSYSAIIEEVREERGEDISRGFIYYHTKGGGSE